MNNQWRNGSKEFVDFTVTLTDPAGEMTLSEAEAIPFEILVGPGIDTPARDDADWTEPSVPKVVSADGASFKVEIQHMYTAAATGLHGVFVKFGPTPEEPIYLATQFVVL